MYDKINITEIGLQILSLFTEDYDSSYYIREVQRKLNISPRTAQIILNDLEEKGILESKLKGKIREYSLKRNETVIRYIMMVEQYKLISFLQKNILLSEIIEKITPSIKGSGIIFGSYAKGLQKKDSDLDIFIIGEYNKEEIRKVSKKYGIDISIKCYPQNIFEKNKNNDILVREVIKSHVLFLNSEEFIRAVLKYD